VVLAREAGPCSGECPPAQASRRYRSAMSRLMIAWRLRAARQLGVDHGRLGVAWPRLLDDAEIDASSSRWVRRMAQGMDELACDRALAGLLEGNLHTATGSGSLRWPRRPLRPGGRALRMRCVFHSSGELQRPRGGDVRSCSPCRGCAGTCGCCRHRNLQAPTFAQTQAQE